MLSGLRVLVVDDDPDARELVRVLLEERGSCVTTAATADEALRAFSSAPPDVLISDVGMPAQSGYDLIRRVRSLAPSRGGDVPAVALTAYAGRADDEEAIAAGYTIHVPKPVDPVELLSTVASIARRPADA